MRRTLLAYGLMLPALWASSTATWEMTTYADFLKGRFSGVSLTRDGRLMLAPKLETLFASEQPAVWSVARAQDGTIYAGTGHKGRVFRIDPAGRSSLLWTAAEPEVFAVAVDAKGVLFAATSPDGKVYRIENGKADEYFAPQARYIWSLAFAPDGALFVGTGEQGKIFRVIAPGKGEVYYETGQTHVTCLGFDAQARLLAGSEPNGILYRVMAKDKAFVLYDANLPEIRSIVSGPDGSVYVAALGGSIASRAASAGAVQGVISSPATVGASGTSITVTDTQAGVEIKPKQETPKPAQAQTQVTTQISPILDMSGVEKSALYKINPDNTVETLWSSKEENIYDVLLSGTQLVFATDLQGRIYRMTPDRKAALLLQTNESETTRLLEAGGSVLASTSNMGKIFRMGAGYGSTGSFESPVHDAGSVARWGRLSWRALKEQDCRLAFRTRSGNSARPDKTWSDWSEALDGAESAVVKSPNARYVQWRAEFGGAGKSALLDTVIVTYLPQNATPVVKSIGVNMQAATGAAQTKSTASAASQTGSYSITVSDTPDSGPAASAGTSTQALSRSGSQQLQISWQAEDPDGDRLVYAVYFRGEEEREWKLLKANVSESSLPIDADALADGRYFFRVVASDRLVNPAGAAREAELISPPILIDNTPPLVKAGAAVRQGDGVAIEIEATDAASALRRAEYSVDAGPWTPLEASDGIIDSPSERFRIAIENLNPGEHIVVIRVYDAAGNAGLAKVVVR